MFLHACGCMHSIQQVFAPHIVSYLEKEEITLREELDEALIRESWLTDNCTEVQHVHFFNFFYQELKYYGTGILTIEIIS